MKERRSARRVPIVVKIEAQAGGFPFIALSQNLSTGGMLIRTADPLPEGQLLHLRFSLPGSDQVVHADATVEHIVPGQFMGVAFVAINAEDQQALEELAKAD